MPRPIRRLLTVALAMIALAAAVPDVSAAGPTYPTQSLGNRGTDVQAIQWLLIARGHAVDADGVFADTTRAAAKAFQEEVGIKANGVVGDATWARLVMTLETGDEGPAVKALQRELKAKRGADIPVDGVFGASTRKAVRTFQGHMGLTVTGRATAGTWRRLVWHYERPSFGKQSVCDYQVGNGKADWGTAAAIGQIEAAADRFIARGDGPVSIGDVSRQHGGPIALHQTHEQGLDVDIRPIRKAGDQCRWGVNWRWSTYDRKATRALVKAIRATAPGHIKVIYFNDPVLIKAGLTTWFAGHDDHLHVRYCEKSHPLKRYDC